MTWHGRGPYAVAEGYALLQLRITTRKSGLVVMAFGDSCQNFCVSTRRYSYALAPASHNTNEAYRDYRLCYRTLYVF